MGMPRSLMPNAPVMTVDEFRIWDASPWHHKISPLTGKIVKPRVRVKAGRVKYSEGFFAPRPKRFISMMLDLTYTKGFD